MINAFTAGVMWQALSSQDNAVELKHMLMLPQHGREFVFSYVAALGAYTVLTKTGLLLAVLMAVSAWKPIEMTGMAISMLHGVLMAAAAYSLRKYWYAGGLWAVAIVSAILFLGSGFLLDLLLLANSLVAILILWKADGYAFYQGESEKHPLGIPVCAKSSAEDKKSHAVKQRKRGFLWRYFFRYPGQKRHFCIPYCLFIFSCNMAADAIFPYSWQRQNGGVTVLMIAGAVFFALQSAVLAVEIAILLFICGRHPK